VQSGRDFGHLRVAGGEASAPERNGEQSDCHSVTREADPVAAALELGLSAWRRDRDPKALRAMPGRLLAAL
jgi:hypothetical protein